MERATLLGMAKGNALKIEPLPALGSQEKRAAERRAKLLAFFADPPPDILAAADAIGRSFERYGEDSAREIADIEAGRHPLQGKTIAG